MRSHSRLDFNPAESLAARAGGATESNNWRDDQNDGLMQPHRAGG